MAFFLKLALAAALGVGLFHLSRSYPNSMDAQGVLVTAVAFAILVGALLFAPGPRRSRTDPPRERAPDAPAPPPSAEAAPLPPTQPQAAPPRPTAAPRRPLTHLAAWVAIFVFVMVAYDNRDVLRAGALRFVSALAPGEPVALGPGEVVLTRGEGGHFVARAEINGASLRLLVDTGATDVAIPFEDAGRLGIDPSQLTFDRAVLTANGQALVATLRLDEVAIGDIRLRNVSAAVAEPGKLSSPLLGMSFLGRLSEFVFRGDKLILKR